MSVVVATLDPQETQEHPDQQEILVPLDQRDPREHWEVLEQRELQVSKVVRVLQAKLDQLECEVSRDFQDLLGSWEQLDPRVRMDQWDPLEIAALLDFKVLLEIQVRKGLLDQQDLLG